MCKNFNLLFFIMIFYDEEDDEDDSEKRKDLDKETQNNDKVNSVIFCILY